MHPAKTKEESSWSVDMNSSQWARTTNLPVCFQDRITAERATGCASEDCFDWMTILQVCFVIWLELEFFGEVHLHAARA